MRAKRKKLFFLGLILGGLVLEGHLAAQVQLFPVSGIVVDASSQKPLPAADIMVPGADIHTISNEEGKFTILLPAGVYTLIVQYVGFKNDTLVVQPGRERKTWRVQLKPIAYSLPPITITAEKYNEAERVIFKAIQKKEQIWSHLRNYQFKAYAKTVMRVALKRGGKIDTTIAAITETQIEGQFKRPDQYLERIVARRQTRNITPANNIFTPGRIPNLNDDVIALEANRIIGPTHPRALEYYNFEMLDTLMRDRLAVFEIRMVPRSQLVPLFRGKIWLIDSLYQVIAMQISGNSAVNLGVFKDVVYEGKFACFSDSFYLPVSVVTRAKIQMGIPGIPPVYFEQTVVLYDYQVNVPRLRLPFNQYQLSVSPLADRRDSLYWQTKQKLPLTQEEIQGYRKIDSIMVHRSFLNKAVIALLQLPFRMQFWPITSFSDLYHFNRIEGHYWGVGIRWPLESDHFSSRFTLGYGLSDRKWKYRVETGLSWPISEIITMSGGIKVYRTLRPIAQSEPFSRGWVTYMALFNKLDYYDYYEARGVTMDVSLTICRSTTLGMGFSWEKHQSVVTNTDFSFFAREKIYPPNPVIRDGQYHTLSLKLRYDNRRFLQLGLLNVPVFDRNSWTFQLESEFSASRWGSRENYWRLWGQLQRHQLTFWSGFLDLFFLWGQGSSLPLQKQFTLFLPYNNLTKPGTFKSAVSFRRTDDRVWMFLLEHHFGNWPVRWIPGLNRFTSDFVLFFNQGQLGQEETFREVGVAFSRIFTFLRLNFVWELRRQGQFSVTLEAAM